MWLSLMKPITLRPVSCSISRLTSACMTLCQRRRRSRTAAPWPASARVCSPCVRLSWSTTKTPFSPSVVFAFVGPRPVVRASALTTVVEILAASSPSGHWRSLLIAGFRVPRSIAVRDTDRLPLLAREADPRRSGAWQLRPHTGRPLGGAHDAPALAEHLHQIQAHASSLEHVLRLRGDHPVSSGILDFQPAAVAPEINA